MGFGSITSTAEKKSWSAYRNALKDVIERGEWTPSPQGPRALTAMQVTMRFPLSDGFPLITERSIKSFWQKPIGELCAFMNGATTTEQLSEFGCNWWDEWTTKEKTEKRGLAVGDIGPGSYGAAFHDFPAPDGSTFDQFSNLIEQIRQDPDRRTLFVSPWIPFYQFKNAGLGRKATVSPCHGWVHVRILNDKLNLHMYQRSGDLPIGVPSNMVQYGALLLMMSHLTGIEPGTYFHTISDAHIYEDQVPGVLEMISRPVRELPTVFLNDEGKKVTDILDFRGEHFDVKGYDPHPSIRIPVAI